MSDEIEFDRAELREWADDPRGRIFWDRLKKEFAEANEKMRLAVREGKISEASVHEGTCIAIEDTLNLPALLIEEFNEDREEKLNEL